MGPSGSALAAILAFLLGAALILAARRHARATTAVLAGALALLCLVGIELAVDRLGVPSGDAEAGRLFWPKDRWGSGGATPARRTASS